MPSLSTLPVFVAASLALLLLPGPAVLFIVARSSAQGTRAGLVCVLGVHSATLVHVIAAVAGLSAIVITSAFAFTTIKVLGGLYLIVVGVQSLRAGRATIASAEPTARARRRLFSEGFFVSLFNPKVALFFLAFLPQFVISGHGSGAMSVRGCTSGAPVACGRFATPRVAS